MENYIHNQKFSNQTFKSLTNKPTPKTDIQEIETLEIKLVASFADSSNSNMRKQALKKLVQDMFRGFPGGTVVKNLPANAGDMGSSPGLGRSQDRKSVV